MLHSVLEPSDSAVSVPMVCLCSSCHQGGPFQPTAVSSGPPGRKPLRTCGSPLWICDFLSVGGRGVIPLGQRLTYGQFCKELQRRFWSFWPLHRPATGKPPCCSAPCQHTCRQLSSVLSSFGYGMFLTVALFCTPWMTVTLMGSPDIMCVVSHEHELNKCFAIFIGLYSLLTFYFETGSHDIALAGPKLTDLCLPLSPKC